VPDDELHERHAAPRVERESAAVEHLHDGVLIVGGERHEGAALRRLRHHVDLREARAVDVA
jgi:hypothetical protein